MIPLFKTRVLLISYSFLVMMTCSSPLLGDDLPSSKSNKVLKRIPIKASQGVAGWHSRKKINQAVFPGSPSQVPTLIDRIQGFGSFSGGKLKMNNWYTDSGGKSIPTANHPTGPKGEPPGGNFLMTDGHVEWFKLSQVELGSNGGSWQCIYKAPVD